VQLVLDGQWTAGSPLKLGWQRCCRLDQEPGALPFAKRWCWKLHSGLTVSRIRGRRDLGLMALRGGETEVFSVRRRPREAPSGRGCTCSGPHSPEVHAGCPPSHLHHISSHRIWDIYKAVSIHSCHGRLRGQIVVVSWSLGRESPNVSSWQCKIVTELHRPFDLGSLSVQDVVAPCTQGPLLGH
jgi:hypothetical protein